MQTELLPLYRKAQLTATNADLSAREAVFMQAELLPLYRKAQLTETNADLSGRLRNCGRFTIVLQKEIGTAMSLSPPPFSI